MALTATELSDGAMVRNVILFSVLVYELVGPALTKRSLQAAGEITDGKTSARTINKPKTPVSIKGYYEFIKSPRKIRGLFFSTSHLTILVV